MKKTLKIDEIYTLDAKYNTSCNILLIVIYGNYFGRVRSIDGLSEWNVMLNRLTEFK